MSSFKFQHILPFEQRYASRNLLWIWHATKIPPHIGISSNGHYFSLKVSGKDENLKVEKVMAIINAKSIPVVFVELNHNFTSADLELEFNKFQIAAPNFSTCLTPIKYLLETSEAHQLSDLLHKLEEKNTLGKFFGVNLPIHYDRLPEYSSAEIQQRLLKLEDAQRKTNLS